MTTWKVLRLDQHDPKGPGPDDRAWFEVGEFETESSYWLGSDAANKIGEQFGAGSFLLLTEEDERFKRLEIATRPTFFEVEQPESAVTGTAVETPA